LENRRRQAQNSASFKLKAKWKPPTITSVSDGDVQSNGTDLQQTFARETPDHAPEKKQPVVKIEQVMVNPVKDHNKKYMETLPHSTTIEKKKDIKDERHTAFNMELHTATKAACQDVTPKAGTVPEANVQCLPQKLTYEPKTNTPSVDKPLPVVKSPASVDKSGSTMDKLARFRYPVTPKFDEPVLDNADYQDNIAVVEEELSELQFEESIAKRDIQRTPSNVAEDADMDMPMDEMLPIAADEHQPRHSIIPPSAATNGHDVKELNNHLECVAEEQYSAASSIVSYNNNVPANTEDKEMNAGQKRPVIDKTSEELVG
jgi:hypothetical protein